MTKPDPNKDSEMEGQWDDHVDKEAVRRVLRKNLHALKDCYERELKIQKDLRGKVVVVFEIQDNGIIKSTKIKKTTLNNKPIEECVMNIIARTEFPPPPKGTTAIISYPFVFDDSKK